MNYRDDAPISHWSVDSTLSARKPFRPQDWAIRASDERSNSFVCTSTRDHDVIHSFRSPANASASKTSPASELQEDKPQSTNDDNSGSLEDTRDDYSSTQLPRWLSFETKQTKQKFHEQDKNESLRLSGSFKERDQSKEALTPESTDDFLLLSTSDELKNEFGFFSKTAFPAIEDISVGVRSVEPIVNSSLVVVGRNTRKLAPPKPCLAQNDEVPLNSTSAGFDLEIFSGHDIEFGVNNRPEVVECKRLKEWTSYEPSRNFPISTFASELTVARCDNGFPIIDTGELMESITGEGSLTHMFAECTLVEERASSEPTPTVPLRKFSSEETVPCYDKDGFRKIDTSELMEYMPGEKSSTQTLEAVYDQRKASTLFPTGREVEGDNASRNTSSGTSLACDIPWSKLGWDAAASDDDTGEKSWVEFASSFILREEETEVAVPELVETSYCSSDSEPLAGTLTSDCIPDSDKVGPFEPCVNDNHENLGKASDDDVPFTTTQPDMKTETNSSPEGIDPFSDEDAEGAIATEPISLLETSEGARKMILSSEEIKNTESTKSGSGILSELISFLYWIVEGITGVVAEETMLERLVCGSCVNDQSDE